MSSTGNPSGDLTLTSGRAATVAIGLALPAVAQVDPGRSSPLAAGMGGKQTQAQAQEYVESRRREPQGCP
jgi:hypothetical protein